MKNLLLLTLIIAAVGCKKETSQEKTCRTCEVQQREYIVIKTYCGKDSTIIAFRKESDSVYNNCR